MTLCCTNVLLIHLVEKITEQFNLNGTIEEELLSYSLGKGEKLQIGIEFEKPGFYEKEFRVFWLFSYHGREYAGDYSSYCIDTDKLSTYIDHEIITEEVMKTVAEWILEM